MPDNIMIPSRQPAWIVESYVAGEVPALDEPDERGNHKKNDKNSCFFFFCRQNEFLLKTFGV
jgi:hypothetical protein